MIFEMKVSVDRITAFLKADEINTGHCILDAVAVEPCAYTRVPQHQTVPGTDNHVLVISDGSFRWRAGKAAKEDELTKQKKKRAALEAAQQNSELQPEQQCEIESLDVEICRLEQAIESCGDSPLLPVQGGATLHGINLVAKKGSITLLQGPVGCGKSTLLQGILNEVPLEAGCLTLAGPSVAFCSQEPFILHSTVKDNIVFGRPWNAKRYKMALEACALIADISTLAEAKATRQKLERKVSIYLVDKRLG